MDEVVGCSFHSYRWGPPIPVCFVTVQKSAWKSSLCKGVPQASRYLQSRSLDGGLVDAASTTDAALKRRQASAAFHQTTVRSSRLSVLVLNQCVRVRMGKKWVLGNVKVVCQKSDSCGDHSGCQRVSQKPEDNELLPQCSGQRGSSSAYDWLPFEV